MQYWIKERTNSKAVNRKSPVVACTSNVYDFLPIYRYFESRLYSQPPCVELLTVIDVWIFFLACTLVKFCTISSELVTSNVRHAKKINKSIAHPRTPLNWSFNRDRSAVWRGHFGRSAICAQISIFILQSAVFAHWTIMRKNKLHNFCKNLHKHYQQ